MLTHYPIPFHLFFLANLLYLVMYGNMQLPLWQLYCKIYAKMSHLVISKNETFKPLVKQGWFGC